MARHTLTLLAALAASLAGTPAHADQPPAISGHWESPAPEHYGQVFATRAFRFTGKHWQVVYRAYADAQARQPLFTLHVGGFYVLGGPSEQVPGAVEGVFAADHRDITAESEAGVALFAGAGCPLKQGRRTPLLSKGCGPVPALMQAMGEYDLVQVRGGQLFLGDRGADLTKARPTALTPYPLVRR